MTEPAETPLGWTKLTLGNVGKWSGGGTPSKNHDIYWNDGTVPWISPKDMKLFRIFRTEDRISEKATIETAAKPIPKGSILIVIRSGILSRTLPVAINEVVATVNQDMKAITPHKGLICEFIAYQLILQERAIRQTCCKDGTTVPSVEVSQLIAHQICLAPTNEQNRIISKIEELFSELDAGVAALERVRAGLKRYRAAVLDSVVSSQAFEGLEDQSDRHGSATSRLGSMIISLDQGWSPKCESSPIWESKQWGVIKTTAIQAFRFNFVENKRLPDTLEPRPQLSIQKDDVLITRAGPRNRVGVTCLARESMPHLMLCDKAYRLRCNTQRILPAYLEIALNAPQIINVINSMKTGISDSGVNLTQDKVLDLVIPTPSIKIQSRVVTQVEQIISVVEALEKQVEANLKRAARLRQCILKRAFEGKLVPQDSADEPAEALLTRIRQSSAAEATPKRRKAPGRPRSGSKRGGPATPLLTEDDAKPGDQA